MSTRSAIIAKIGDSFHGVYCHSDGYIEGVGAMLLQHYRDPAKVEQLIALGSLSCLGEVIGEKHDFDWVQAVYKGGDWSLVTNDPRSKFTRAYHRDRGEELDIAKGHSVDWVAGDIGHDGYVYVFDGKWSVGVRGNSLTDLAEHYAELVASKAKKTA